MDSPAYQLGCVNQEPGRHSFLKSVPLQVPNLFPDQYQVPSGLMIHISFVDQDVAFQLRGRICELQSDEPLPNIRDARLCAAESIRRLPTSIRSLFDTDQQYRVEHSQELLKLYEQVQNENGLLRHRHAN